MGLDPEWARPVQRELRVILNEWDPIGVHHPAEPGDAERPPDDEYDCLRDRLLGRLVHVSASAGTASNPAQTCYVQRAVPRAIEKAPTWR